ncbi:restriction endonuclease subunit S [Botrimarina mediterranea]|nr:restriction endonuclease subunit S [Botrimarina mediterranea]
MASRYVEIGIPFLRSQNVKRLQLDLSETKFIPESFHAELQKSRLRPGDVVIVRTGEPGSCAVIPDTLPDSNCSDLVIVRPGSELDARFLSYYVNAAAQHHVASHLVGAVQQHFNVGAARTLPLNLPPFFEQLAIVGVLGALDDKIEQNRRTAEGLEKLARAIFRAWFVDFEPVHAKAAGATSFPGMPPAVFDSLPTRLVDSELGPIPEGWGVERLSTICEVNPKRAIRKGDVAPYLDMKGMPTSGHAPSDWIDRPFGSGMRFINGDTLVARITPCLENGKTAYVDFLEPDQVAWGSTEYIVLRPLDPNPPIFAYCLARTDEFRDFAVQNMSGTSGRQRVPAEAMDHYRLANPSRSCAEAFGKIVEPLFARVRAGIDESRKLAELRDYLLPKLLSGEVRVNPTADEEAA